MRVVVGLLLLLLGLCGSGAQGEAGGLGEVAEINQNTDPKHAAEESTEQTTKQTTCDIWTELRALRDMVVEQKVHMELLQRENSVQATELLSLESRLTSSESKTSDLEKENADLQTRLSSSESELLISKSRIDQLERENADLQTRLSSSESRIDQLETENAVQATELTSLGTRLTATESKTSDLEKENADLQTRLSSSESRIDQLERENAVQATELVSLESRLTSSESKTSDLEKENAEKPKVAFYTALTDAGTLGPYNTDITLKYSKVFTNIGNAYNPSTGFFTAPVKGVYYLQFTVFGCSAGHIGVRVYKNNQRIMHNWEHNNNDYFPEYFTNSLVLELTAGDEIHLVLPSGHSIYDNSDNYSTFSGSLLFTL
uniref:C1q domain-containing protein n=1 Tax=Sparus aurata TaxID=8175 RepID=A0A671X2Q0_SPAAU